MYAPYPDYILDESDLRTFLREPAKKTSVAGPILGSVLLAAGISFGAYYLLNLQAFQRANDTAVAATQATPAPSATPSVSQAVPTPAPVVNVSTIPDNTVSYTGLSISAPVTWDVSVTDVAAQNAILPNSLIQMSGTAHPGQHGMVVISGHSSNYPWIKGSYNTVFAPLEQAKVGQTISVSYQNREYTYQVTNVYKVKPTQLNVLNSASFDGLRLITCTPVGTSLNRLVVEAKQISPDPATNADFTQKVFTTGTIPSGS